MVKIWEEDVSIPSYEVGAADKNPMFLEKRVYQGSSGKVYPYPTIESISREKKDKLWRAVYLENEYLKIMILPQLGGRIQRAYDKTNDYDFVYYNRVIKPALVGLTGPWISGGIEFNWPQHHRPTSFMPLEYRLQAQEDGSKTLLVHDVDQMYGTKALTAFTLYPGKAYIEIKGQLYNRTALPQTFLWWANPAVAVNEHTQSVFPPDVHTVYDHGKRAVSSFPMATGVYYKHDYSEGVDISRYKNIPVPTSYMAESSKYDFVGGYDEQRQAGLLHVADHHISPGKKQWTWGCGDFGKAWDRNLTDEDGPYIELMTGIFTENQPDFTWMKAFEEKCFTQYFMPYKRLGYIKNASRDAALNLEFGAEGMRLSVYATGRFEGAQLVIDCEGREIFRDTALLSPVDIYERTLPVYPEIKSRVCVRILHGGRELLRYQPEPETIPTPGKPAEAAEAPDKLRTNEELLLTAQHIEQHRHALYLPDPYYLEGLKRDPGDSRINNAYGLLLLRRGCFEAAETCFRKAVERLTWRSPNPYNSEPYYHLGLSLWYQEREAEAYDAFYKASWSLEQQEMSYFYLAVLALRADRDGEALAFVEQALVKNAHNIKARALKAVILRRLGREAEAAVWLEANLTLDPFDYVSIAEQCRLNGTALPVLGTSHEAYLQLARDYMEAGCLNEALEALAGADEKQPLPHYYRARCLQLLGQTEAARSQCMKAEAQAPDYCFPNKPEDIAVLKTAIALYPEGAKAPYYLGNLYYDKLQYEQAIQLWEQSAALDGDFPTVYRNLAIAYANKRGDWQAARECMERAFALNESDVRVFFELDQLYKKLNLPFAQRLVHYEAHSALIAHYDPAQLERASLYNLCGQAQKAYDSLMSYDFRPWEGAEGKVPAQYKAALLKLTLDAWQAGAPEKAEGLLMQALMYPDNLGEGRLEGTRDNDLYYYLGCIREQLGRQAEAVRCFELASVGEDEPAGALYYYDQPADMILYKGLACLKLGERRAAGACFHKLQSYGERHLRDEQHYDFFAVSLPDFAIFDDNLQLRHRAHCYYLMGLACLGLQETEQAKTYFKEALRWDGNHQKCHWYLALLAQMPESLA